MKNKTTDFNKFPAPSVRFNAQKSTRNRVVAPLVSAGTNSNFRPASTIQDSSVPTAVCNQQVVTTNPGSTLSHTSTPFTIQTISIAVPTEKCPFRTLIEEWLDYGRADDLASKTIADYHDKVYKFWWWWHDHTHYAHKLGAHPKNVTVKQAREYAVYLREPQEVRWGIEAKVKKPKLSASVSSYGRAVKVFFNWLEAENYADSWIWLTVDGQTLSFYGCESIVRRIRRDSGVHFHPHMLRHTFASTLAEQGVNAFDLKSLLGHKTVTTTQIYVHQNVQHLNEVHRPYSPLAALPGINQQITRRRGRPRKGIE